MLGTMMEVGVSIGSKADVFENRGGVGLETPLCTRDFPSCTLYSSGALYNVASAGTKANSNTAKESMFMRGSIHFSVFKTLGNSWQGTSVTHPQRFKRELEL